jgi:hypothetical protein
MFLGMTILVGGGITVALVGVTAGNFLPLFLSDGPAPNLCVARDVVELQCQPGTGDNSAGNKGADSLTETMTLHKDSLLVKKVSNETKDDG